MSVYISLFTVAVPVNFTSEFSELFEDAAYVLPQLKRFAIVDDVEFFVSNRYFMFSRCTRKVISNTFPSSTYQPVKMEISVHLHYFVYPSNYEGESESKDKIHLTALIEF